MNKNQLKKIINNLQTYLDDKIVNLPVSYEEKLLLTVPKESIDKSKADTATIGNPYTINIPIANGFEYVDGMFNNADIIIEYNDKKYMNNLVMNTPTSTTVVYAIELENNNFGFIITKDNSAPIELDIYKLDTANITDIKLYMRKKDVNINDLKVNNSISIGRMGNIGIYSSAIGNGVKASGNFSHAEGDSTTASGLNSHAEGNSTTASGNYGSHAEGNRTTASSDSSHAEGANTTASGTSSHAEGDSTTASGESSHAEGIGTVALGNYSHAEGYSTTASSDSSHAEGSGTVALGNYSHAEGNSTTSSGENSHAEGNSTTSSGENSHAEGLCTKASSENQHVQGKCNIEDTANKYAHIVGNGKDNDNRSNAHTLDWEGNAWYSGKLFQEGTPTEDKDLTTKKYVDDKVSSLPQFSFNESGELVVTINGVSKIFVPKDE